MTVTAPTELPALPRTPFSHLQRLTDAGGLYEHALATVPRREHGYCVDDVARALVVCAREPGADVAGLAAGYLAFVLAAEDGTGRFRNRRAADLSWQGSPTVEDCWGRAVWGLGATIAAGGAQEQLARECFARAAAQRSPWSRATAFAGLGAAAVLAAEPDCAVAATLLGDAARTLGRPSAADPRWPWPERRLRYANGALCEVLLAAGNLLDDPTALQDGLTLLAWLLSVQTLDGHLSVVPVAGRCVTDRGAGFDQQPIEVAALADACARAYDLTGEDRWAAAVQLCAEWFLGRNDAATVMFDPVSGGGYDGLERRGCNTNQGAESTLSLISTLQQAHRIAGAR